MNRKLLLLSMATLFSLTACGKSNENISSDLEEVVTQEPIIDSNGSLTRWLQQEVMKYHLQI